MAHSTQEELPAGILLYQTEDRRTRIEVRLEGETVWLTQKQMAELYQVAIPTINEHLRHIYADGELPPEATIRKFRTVRKEGARDVARQLDCYNLEAVLAVGFRVRSLRGTQFRQWATERLKEYVVKGFALDDERLKRADASGYFDELLERIRDIRSSERVFYRKVLDIYATSVDYDPRAESSQAFFAAVQNRMHWATHGQTAAEVIADRADAAKPNMGLTTWTGSRVTRQDAAIAKNYLTEDELAVLNRIVNAYLEFAELQALRRRPMTMRAWIGKLDDFLRMSERDILTHAGTVSHERALQKAEEEYDRFRLLHARDAKPVDHDFDSVVRSAGRLAKKVESGKRKPAKGKKSE